MQCIRTHVLGTGYILKIKHVHKSRDARMQPSVSALLEGSVVPRRTGLPVVNQHVATVVCSITNERNIEIFAQLVIERAAVASGNCTVGVGDDKPAGLLIFRPRASFRLGLVFPTSRHSRRTIAVFVCYSPPAVSLACKFMKNCICDRAVQQYGKR